MNNAGITLPQMKLVQMSAARIKEHFEVNTLSTILCSREAIKRMAKSHGHEGGAITVSYTHLYGIIAPVRIIVLSCIWALAKAVAV